MGERAADHRDIADTELGQDRPCPPGLMAEITDHFVELLRGRSGFVYSPRGGMGTEVIRAKMRTMESLRLP